MTVRKDTKNGKWLAEVYVNGKRSRKWFLTKGDALRFYNQAKDIKASTKALKEASGCNR